jgi:hypothetical protein
MRIKPTKVAEQSVKIPVLIWSVASETDPSKTYDVAYMPTLGKWTCTCLGDRFHKGECKHIHFIKGVGDYT